jgi:hypothetical protein
LVGEEARVGEPPAPQPPTRDAAGEADAERESTCEQIELAPSVQDEVRVNGRATRISPTRDGDDDAETGRKSMSKKRRTLRLSAKTNWMVEQLATARGLDANSTIAVAIAEDFFRLFGPVVARPDHG